MKRLMLLAVPVTLVVAALTARFAGGQQSDGPTFGDNVFSRTQIIELDNGDVFRLDTATGELFRFRGDLRGGDADGVFRSVARPVNGQNSGFLELQEAGGGVFLVDVVTGTTWIFRQRSNSAAWIRVDEQ